MITVVIPVKDGGEDLMRCLDGVAAQRVDEEVEVVVVDSGSTDASVDRARAAGAVVTEIDPAEFGHGRTRNLGVQIARGELLVFTSQDAVANDERWLAGLAAAARSGAEVAGAYGRQLPHHDARPPDRRSGERAERRDRHRGSQFPPVRRAAGPARRGRIARR